jgi:predicted neuraminidase
MYQGAPSVERAANGRLWAAWYGGGTRDELHNYVILATSDDDGRTWSPSRMVLDPDGCGPVRAFDPCLWIDPQGRLWLFWGQEDRHGMNTLAMVAAAPVNAAPGWSKPRHIGEGVMAGKPMVLKTGDWLAPVWTWMDERSCRVLRSRDKGATWETAGAVAIADKKDRSRNESMIVERTDGSLWLLVRTGYGIGESVSTDGGKTWSAVQPSAIPHPAAHFLIRRLHSGRLLLVRHAARGTPQKSHLTAFLSDDDGRTWSPGLLIDARGHAAHPDAVEEPDGKIRLIYETQRWKDKQILMLHVTEQDVQAGGVVPAAGRFVVNQASGPTPVPPGLAHIPALPDFSPGPQYADRLRMQQGVPSIERAANGRLWAVWYGGGVSEDMHSYVMLATSGDDGRTWSPIKLVIDPDGCGPMRAFDPCLWHDPRGRLWLFWGQQDGFGMHNIAMVTTNSGSPDPAWSKPRLISAGVMLNKPTVLRSGEWLLPTCIWRDERSSRVIASTDEGVTWELRGSARIPRREDRNGDENMIVERKDGSLWMLVRTGYGMGESVSRDRGRTWSDVARASISHAEARFFIRRLQSGRLLLVRHNAPDITQRSHLTAFLSDDDGRTWSKGLMIDERGGVSYPDGIEGQPGEIRLIYDYLRTRYGQILMTVVSEREVANGAFAPGARRAIVVNEVGGHSGKGGERHD